MAANALLQSNWKSCLDEYTRCLERNIHLDSDDGLPVAEKLALQLGELLYVFVSESKIKDEWLRFKWGATSSGVFVDTYSKKQNHKYTLGLYGHEVYISSSVLEAQNIKGMNDEFWLQFAELTKAGNFCFNENAGLPRSLINICDSSVRGSGIFKLIKNYVLFEEHSPGNTVDLGWFEFRWAASESIDTIRLSGISAFKGVYKLNYLLYRNQHIKEKSKIKKEISA